MKADPAKNRIVVRPSHGGDLSVASELLNEQNGDEDWLDLSTGINLTSYPLPQLDNRVWNSLPDNKLVSKCLIQARDYYQVPANAEITAINGSQSAIQLLPSLFEKTTVSILGPTYSEHCASWSTAGHCVNEYDDFSRLTSDIGPQAAETLNISNETAHGHGSFLSSNPDSSCSFRIRATNVIIFVNPNNPDGRLIPQHEIKKLVSETCKPDDWLIIDEAFMDLSPENSAVDQTTNPNCIVLKSFGKFFGLAGLRLGFLIGSGFLVDRLSELMGPWPVNGPALEIGTRALSDKNWQNEMRVSLRRRKNQMDSLLKKYNYNVTGASFLFQFIETEDAEGLFNHLLQHKIYVRKFNRFPNHLRIGTPSLDTQFDKLEYGLRTFRTNR